MENRKDLEDSGDCVELQLHDLCVVYRENSRKKSRFSKWKWIIALSLIILFMLSLVFVLTPGVSSVKNGSTNIDNRLDDQSRSSFPSIASNSLFPSISPSFDNSNNGWEYPSSATTSTSLHTYATTEQMRVVSSGTDHVSTLFESAPATDITLPTHPCGSDAKTGTNTPSSEPTLPPSTLPSMGPSLIPTSPLTLISTPAPSSGPSSFVYTSAKPSYIPSLRPSAVPIPSTIPSASPSSPSSAPSTEPTASPSTRPSFSPKTIIQTSHVSSFLAIADVPYTEDQAIDLAEQMRAVSDDADFLVHIGDIRSARDGSPCKRSDYTDAAALLSLSSIPVFIVPGDNEWQDCPNMKRGIQFWYETFSQFEDHWPHDFQVRRLDGYPESFEFLWKGTLYIGLNIVGGQVHNASEWAVRLGTQADWVISLIRQHRVPTVLFGHANPSSSHGAFFNRVASFIENETQNEIPILYVNGDKHRWNYTNNFYGQSSWTRITLTGGSSEPPLRVSVNSSASALPENIFQYDRGLE